MLQTDLARPQIPAFELERLGYAHKRWTSADGLPQNSINSIAQTRDGYLWLATYGGLTRFNGSEFSVFNHTTHPDLLSNRITSLYVDAEDVLWIGHEYEGLNAYSTGRFTAFTPADGMPSGTVHAIVKDTGGALWVGTREGLGRLQNGRWARFTRLDGLPSDDVRALAADRDCTLWLGTPRGGARYIAGRFEKLTTTEDVPPGPVSSFLEDSEGLLIGATEGIVRHSEGVFELHTFAENQPRRLASRALTRWQGTLWAASAPSGHLLRFRVERVGNHIERVRRNLVVLPEASKPWSTFVDREGNFWIGTIGAGLLRLRRQPVKRYTVDDGLPALEPRVVTTDGDGGLWIGFSCPGAHLIRITGGLVEDFAAAVTDELPVCASALWRDDEDALWIGGGDNGGELMRWQDGTLARGLYADHLPGRDIQALLEDRDGGLWVGTAGGGVVHIPPQGATVPYTSHQGLVHDHVHYLHQDRVGALWIGTNNGLSRLHDGVFTNFTADDGLAPGMVRAIHEDEDGTLWIGTYGGGLSRLAGDHIAKYTTDDGLFDNVVSTIFEDVRGRLWMLGNSGLFFADREHLNAIAEGRTQKVFSVSFATPEGMTEGSGGFQPAGTQTPDGRLWFPTIDGLATIDARRFQIDDEPPPVVIESLSIQGESFPPAAHIHIEKGERDLEIHYAGLSFSAPGRVRYRYILEGYDTAWTEAGDRRVAYYTNLSPGHYTFRVSAANRHGVWNESGDELSLTLAPFFWETWWFYTALAALLVFVGSLTYRIRLRSVEERNRLLREELDVRRQLQNEREELITTLESQKAELERFNYTVSHDLKSPLFTIKGFIGALEDDLANGREDLLAHDIARISEAADKMGAILEQLLELARVGHRRNPPQAISLNEVAHEAADLVRGQISQRGVEVDIDEQMPTVLGDPVRLLEVFENLIENAVKFAGDTATPRIQIGISERQGERLCFVRDNGRGIAPRYQEKIFGIFERLDTATEGTGIGLALVKRIVEDYGGRIWAESEGDGRGSTFWFTLPPGAPLEAPRDTPHDAAPT